MQLAGYRTPSDTEALGSTSGSNWLRNDAVSRSVQNLSNQLSLRLWYAVTETSDRSLEPQALRSTLPDSNDPFVQGSGWRHKQSESARDQV